MKIFSINSLYINNKVSPALQKTNNPVFMSNNSSGDVVSFKAKKYDSETIINPTNHCGYCGCKVYSEDQISSIAKEILSSKYDRMNGQIRSVLEKLEGAKSSEELALAKRLENEEEIKFFKNLAEVASKKAFLRGDAIFSQVYSTDSSTALELVKTNLRPLLKTVDHISPQNEGKDNNNSDINLVEACWCCNHDLKKGTSFVEFYTMYPSIKNNMPSEKFEYAAASLLDSQSNGIIQRLSAANLLKTIQRLFIQRTEAKSYLDSIDFRIKTSISAIDDAIATSKAELQVKEDELAQRQEQLTQIQTDPEFVAIMDRLSYSKAIEVQRGIISQLKSKQQATSNQINELRNPQKKKSNKSQKEQRKEELSPQEKKDKIDSLKAQIHLLDEQILEHEISKEDYENKIKALDKQFLTVPMMQHLKNQADTVISAHLQSAKLAREISDKKLEISRQEDKKAQLEDELSQLPEEFDVPDSFPEDAQQRYNRYLELVDALNYLSDHPNGGGVNLVIKQSARVAIEKEIETLDNDTLVVQYKQQQERKRLEGEIATVTKNINNLNSSMSILKNNKERSDRTASAMSHDEAVRQSEDYANRIRITNEKEQYTKLPQVIDSIKAEIILINQTISDLQARLRDIDSQFPKS